MDGKLIVFEGVEGCGKTTQIHLCHQWLQSLGVDVVVTRQPGGTDLGAHIRQLLLDSGKNSISNRAELLLYAADRAQHVEQLLLPNLAAGKTVLCDRYTDSTIAYQCFGRGLNRELIDNLNHIATTGLHSDLTLWLDIDVATGLARKIKSGEAPDRIEQEKIEFHHRVQQGYKFLANTHPERIRRIDASLTQEVVHKQIQTILTAKLGSH
ncbi:dTMP kinase [Calothrix sp. 336/3]|uniref:dTMP kinase n=1 Tax=Calothrix sp. 336/3 TaxID=1337936 RepID=UPI0004E446D4|nr:dTMP kinase [Calothrix sp. 336/3]AKG24280.1 thymidylate kinase [Calothrix sp. 336/3]